MENYDLAVIGAGWAGFNAAVRAAQLGLKAALVEKGKLGGTCLNLGCIPTKALIQSARVFSLAKKSAVFGVGADNPRINFGEIQQRKEKIINQLSAGLVFQLKNKNIDYINRPAQIFSNEELDLGNGRIKAKHIVIASGSIPAELPAIKFDGKKILSSDDILNLNEVPKSLLIIGGGVIGCEFASLFSALGADVTITELMPQILPLEDKEIGKKLEASFKKRGIKVHTNVDASTMNLDNYSLVLLATGRTPCAQSLSRIEIRREKNGIAVDDYLKTSVPNIYAGGDCLGKTMLAHYAAYQGSLIAENIAHPAQAKKADNTAIPNCIFTDPEVASVGLSEDRAKHLNLDVKINKFDFQASAMARILEEKEGFIKIISDKKTDSVLGACLIGPKATELIGIMTVSLNSRLKVRQIKDTVFAHPTLSESISDCLKYDYGV